MLQTHDPVAQPGGLPQCFNCCSRGVRFDVRGGRQKKNHRVCVQKQEPRKLDVDAVPRRSCSMNSCIQMRSDRRDRSSEGARTREGMRRRAPLAGDAKTKTKRGARLEQMQLRESLKPGDGPTANLHTESRPSEPACPLARRSFIGSRGSHF